MVGKGHQKKHEGLLLQKMLRQREEEKEEEGGKKTSRTQIPSPNG